MANVLQFKNEASHGLPHKCNQITVDGDKAYILIESKHGDKMAIIDAEDVDKIKNYTWAYIKAGYITTNVPVDNGKWKGVRSYKTLYLHRLVTEYKHDVDHMNGVKHDCRKSNLRSGRTLSEACSINAVNRCVVSARRNSGLRGITLRMTSRGLRFCTQARFKIKGRELQTQRSFKDFFSAWHYLEGWRRANMKGYIPVPFESLDLTTIFKRIDSFVSSYCVIIS